MKITIGPCPCHSDRQHRFNYDMRGDLLVCGCGVTMRDPNHPTRPQLGPSVVEQLEAAGIRREEITVDMIRAIEAVRAVTFPRGTRMMFYQSTPPDGWVVVGGPYQSLEHPALGPSASPPESILCEKI